MNSEAMKKARRAYNEKNKIKNIVLAVPEERREKWKAAAAAKGKSLTAYITELIEADIAKSPQI